MEYIKEKLNNVLVSCEKGSNTISFDNSPSLISGDVISINDIDYTILKVIDSNTFLVNKKIDNSFELEEVFLYAIPSYIKNMIGGYDVKLVYVGDVSKPEFIKCGLSTPGWWRYRTYHGRTEYELLYPINIFDKPNNEEVSSKYNNSTDTNQDDEQPKVKRSRKYKIVEK